MMKAKFNFDNLWLAPPLIVAGLAFIGIAATFIWPGLFAETETWLWLAALLLFIAGISYAIYISAIRPFPPRQTYVSVIIGTAMNMSVASFAIWILTANPMATIAPWIATGIGGLTMIEGQLIKHKLQEKIGQGED
jgi:hypothetical protein